MRCQRRYIVGRLAGEPHEWKAKMSPDRQHERFDFNPYRPAIGFAIGLAVTVGVFAAYILVWGFLH